MSMYSSRRRSRQTSRSQLGHLKLSVYEEASTLVVHIIEARGLFRKENAPYDTYVKIYLLPDPQKLTKEKTKIVKHQKDPIFNEKFSLLLSESDQEKKLFISVWTHNFTSRNEMIGCMTFLISDLIGPYKGLNGWYKLLDEIKGRKENIQVPNSITKYSSRVEVEQQPGGYQVFAVTLVRAERGYGFSVHGHNPVSITEVVEGLPAHQSDIKVGDIIMEVEGTDVTRANGDLVVSIVRKCPQTLQLILRRLMVQVSTLRAPVYLPPSGQVRNYGSSLRVRSRSSTAISLSQQDEPMAFTSHARSDYASSSQYLVPEMHDFEHRRFSSPFAHDFVGLTQPNAPYYGGGGGGRMRDPGRLEPDPYLRHVHSHHRKHKSHSSSRSRIPEEPRMDTSGMESYIRGSAGGALDIDQTKKARLPSQRFGGHSSFTNMSSRPPRYSKRSFDYVGSDEHLQQLREQGDHRLAAIGGSFEAIRTAMVPGRYIMTQPTEDYHEEKKAAVHVGAGGLSQGGSVQYPTGKPPRIVVNDEGNSTHRRLKKDLQRSSSLNPHYATLSGRSSHTKQKQKSNSSYQADEVAMATSSILPNGASSGNISDSVAKATNDQEEVPITWETLGSLGQTRQRAMNNLVNAELAFCEELSVGMETYIRPLQAILPESTHTAMFLGLSELHSVSQEISSELKRRKMPFDSPAGSPLPFYVPRVADVYWSKLDLLVSGLETYLENCHKARQEIASAFTNEEFTKHVQESVVDKKKPSIYSFVEAGNEYFPKLCRALMALVYYTPVHHDDQKQLSNIVEAIMKLSSDKELLKKWEEDQETMKSMQIRVGFNTKVQAIIVRVPGRMLLQESEVTFVEKRRKKKVWVLLFSDMMLVTRKQGKVITTIEEPIYLENLVVQDINCDATEFQIQTADGTFSRLIRVSSETEKKQWMEKLKERATGSLGNKRKPPAGEKGHNIRFKDALRLQSKQLLAATLAVDEPDISGNGVTALSAKEAGSGRGEGEGKGGAGEMEEVDMEYRTNTLGRHRKSSTPSKKKAEDSPLRRGTSKRRSL